MKCADCRFFDPKATGNEGEGLCRRHAPSPVERLTQAVNVDDTAWWPVVLPSEWCGEFEEKRT